MARSLLSIVLVGVLLAGCASKAPPAQAEDEFDIELAPTATTGVIRGVVVDEGIRPIANAVIVLKGTVPVNTTSNTNGAFGFSGLEPGTYFMEVSKLGFFSVQSSADVVAGQAEPPIVKILLKTDVASIPFWQAQEYEGYIQCTTSVLVLCGAPAILTGQELTNDRFAWDQYFASNASHIQAEMVWDSTQALSPELYFEMEALNDACVKDDDPKYDSVGRFLNNTSGTSPVYSTINQTEVEAWNIGEVCPVWMSIFSGGAGGTPVGFTVQQKFTMYFHTFHGYLPPPGWRFAVDGTPPNPPS